MWQTVRGNFEIRVMRNWEIDGCIFKLQICENQYVLHQKKSNDKLQELKYFNVIIEFMNEYHSGIYIYIYIP